jgi:hypothetical protein
LKRSSPAALRNREPILAVLREWLPKQGRVLETAAGTGEHAVYFAAAFPQLTWQPSDADPEARESIDAYRQDAGLENLASALPLDVTDPDWPVTSAAAVLAINLVHISPPEAGLALLDGSARLLEPGAPMILYGPWRVRGEPLAPSNLAFDQALKERDPSFGLRDLTTFAAEARARGLELVQRVDMPANNLMLRFVRRG